MDTKTLATQRDLCNFSPAEAQRRRREWNRKPLQDLFPRIPQVALQRLLDICIEKDFTYNLSQSKSWNARRYSSIVVANVRHRYTNYDKLLREEHLERYEARRATAERVWEILREWCPWESESREAVHLFEYMWLMVYFRQ